jgi:hypothetical protein
MPVRNDKKRKKGSLKGQESEGNGRRLVFRGRERVGNGEKMIWRWQESEGNGDEDDL